MEHIEWLPQMVVGIHAMDEARKEVLEELCDLATWRMGRTSVSVLGCTR